jgi:hypothetical protein
MAKDSFTPADRARMMEQYEEVASARRLRRPEIRFYDFIFLREQNDNSVFLSLLSNSPEWAAIAKKSSSDAIFVTDETTLDILKSQKLPAESGIKDKTYFDFLKESGFKFATINQLIKKLPRDSEGWKGLYDKMNILIDNGTLHLASLRDFAKPIVSMGFKDDHHETVTIQKELDIIVNKELATTFANPNDILPQFSIRGIFHGAYSPTEDGVGRILIVDTKETHGEDAQRQRRELIEKFDDYKITSTPEIYTSKGNFIYFGKCLELTLELLNELIKNPRHYQEKVTRDLANRLESIFVINYGPENNAHISNLDLKKFGVVGSILLNSWTSKSGDKFHGQLVKPITEASQIDDITEFRGKISPISWKRIKSITSTSKDESIESPRSLSKKKISDRDLQALTSSSIKSGICPLQQSWEQRTLEFHPHDDPLSYLTPNKALALGLAFASQSLALSSTAISSGNQIVSLSGQIGRLQKSLNPPSSNPALQVKANLLKRSEEKQKS